MKQTFVAAGSAIVAAAATAAAIGLQPPKEVLVNNPAPAFTPRIMVYHGDTKVLNIYDSGVSAADIKPDKHTTVEATQQVGAVLGHAKKSPAPAVSPKPSASLSPSPSPTPSPRGSSAPSPTPSFGAPINSGADEYRYDKKAMNVAAAWAITEGSPDIIVAVIDSGLDITQAELGNLWKDANGQVGWDFVEDHAGVSDPNGHGTHCAGIIAAKHDGVGVAGIAPRVRIMPLRFLEASGYGDTGAAARAVRFAIDHGARVISNSWGGNGSSPTLAALFVEARSRGIVVTAAAGNNNTVNDTQPFYPASYPGVISVGSVSEGNTLSSFSNHGSSVTVLAPGSFILSLAPGNREVEMSGTSMANPQIAAVAALMLSRNPKLTVDQVEQRLCASGGANPAAMDAVVGSKCGLVDAGKAVNSAL